MRLQLTIVTAVLFFIVLTCSAAQAESQVGLDRLRGGHALLIGNYQYQDANWPTLDDVPLQLTALASGLKAHFETVEIVQNLKAEELRRKINSFVRTFGNDPTARLFIYYAGHGYTETILQRNESRGYITGIDTPHFSQGYAVARLKAISMMEIRAPLAEVLAQHILFVFDSCFSGTIFTTRSTPPAVELTPDVVARLLEKPSRDFITAGRANEFVPAHSPLPELLLAALNGEADRYRHGVVSAAEITQYLRDKLLPLRDVNLTPQEGKLPDPAFAEGEFLFRVIPAPIVALPKPAGQNAPEKAAVLAPVPTAVPPAIETSPPVIPPRATGNVYFWVQAKVMDPNNKIQPDFHQPHEGTVEWQLNESKDDQKQTILRADISFPRSTWHALLTIELARNTRALVWKFGFPDI